MPKCTQGDYYAAQGYAPCQDIGTNVQARTYDGDIISGSAELDRGYKAGFGYRENGGNGLNENSGGGGAGARNNSNSFFGGGAGGGYSGGGGAAGTTSTVDNAGGGGSYNSGSNTSNASGNRSGHGQVIISW